MKLSLDHTQRLNLHALLGAQRSDVAGIRSIWNIQDKIALDADEENALELKREMVGGLERVVWNANLLLPIREFDFSELETARIRIAIQTWESYAASTDRCWLQPLVEVLFSVVIGGT